MFAIAKFLVSVNGVVGVIVVINTLNLDYRPCIESVYFIQSKQYIVMNIEQHLEHRPIEEGLQKGRMPVIAGRPLLSTITNTGVAGRWAEFFNRCQ